MHFLWLAGCLVLALVAPITVVLLGRWFIKKVNPGLDRILKEIEKT